MRKLFSILGLGLLFASVGCRHVGGKCDMCAASPGEATLYAPLTGYQTANYPAPVPVTAEPEAASGSKKNETKKDEPKKDPRPMSEELGAPKELPKKGVSFQQ